MGPISLWTSALAIPGGVWIINVIVRFALKHRFLTAGADWLLLLIVFDGTAILAAKDFQQFVRHEPFRNEIQAILAILAILAVAMWVVTVMYFESWIRYLKRRRTPVTMSQKLAELARNPRLLILNRAVALLFISAVLISTTAAHVLAFIWPGPS